MLKIVAEMDIAVLSNCFFCLWLETEHIFIKQLTYEKKTHKHLCAIEANLNVSATSDSRYEVLYFII